MEKYKELYGNFFGGWIGPKFMVVTSDPTLIKTVLNSDGCIDKSNLFVALDYLMKNGILCAKGIFNRFLNIFRFYKNFKLGRKWYQRRKLLNPAFTQPILLEFFDIYNEVVESFMAKIGEKVNSPNFDFQDLLAKCVLEIACRKFL